MRPPDSLQQPEQQKASIVLQSRCVGPLLS
jgi:hypothetical protein